jgi:hypothetical protein
MSTYHLNQGLNHVGSYQVSGVPFIYSSSIGAGNSETVQFPTVSKTVYVENLGSTNPITISFSTSPLAKVIIPAGDSIEMTVKAGSITIESAAGSDYQIYASLTSIPRERIAGITL